MKGLKYISLDIETLGLEPDKHAVIEIAAVADDLTDPQPIEHLQRFHTYVLNHSWCGDPFAMAMHKEKLDRIAKREMPWVYTYAEDVADELWYWLKSICEYDKDELGIIHVTFAGKNFASFDKPFLEAQIPNFSNRIRARHRVIDPGSMFLLRWDEKPPSLEECIKRAGLNDEEASVTHNAMDDAIAVIQTIRKKLLGE